MKLKNVIAVVVLLALAGAAIAGALYAAAFVLVRYVGALAEQTPRVSLAFELAQLTVPKLKGFGVIALVLSCGLPTLVFGFIAWAMFGPQRRIAQG